MFLDGKGRLAIKEKIVSEKVTVLLPKLMLEHNLDMWIVSGNDHLCKILLKEPTNSNTMIVFTNKNNEFKAYINTRADFYESFAKRGEDTFEALNRLIKQINPKNIGVNISKSFDELNGCSHLLYQNLLENNDCTEIISAEILAMDISQIRTETELEVYKNSTDYAKKLIVQVMSSELVTPGVTTNYDLRNYMWDKFIENGLIYTWGPNVDMQRKGNANFMIGSDTEEIIQKGDLLHIDFGFEYIGLHTDMQYLAYVLNDDETSPPKALLDGFDKCYNFQKIYMELVRPGLTGNQARAIIMQKAIDCGLDAMVYSHPIGYTVHAVGPSIGRFGFAGDIPHGIYEIKPNTTFAMEQNVSVTVPEWDNQKVFIFREEDVVVLENSVEPLCKLQEKLLVI